MPALGTLYAAGVAGSVRSALMGSARTVTARLTGSARSGSPRTLRSDALPRTQLVLDGVHPDANHLTAYQHLVGEPASDVLPAGFVHVVAFPVAMQLMVRPDFPLPLLGLVHVANRVEQRHALRLGDELDVRVVAQDLRAHRAGVTVDLVAEVGVGGDVAWRGVSTYLAKGVHLAGRDGPAAGTGDPAVGGGPGPDEAFIPPTPTGQWRLAADTGRRYAAVSGDRNPIHTSSLAAKAFGFPRAIAHGMYTASRALADVGAARGEAFVWDVEFAKPVLLPSTVTVRVAADDDAPAAGFRIVAWDAHRGRRHFAGSVKPLG